MATPSADDSGYVNSVENYMGEKGFKFRSFEEWVRKLDNLYGQSLENKVKEEDPILESMDNKVNEDDTTEDEEEKKEKGNQVMKRSKEISSKDLLSKL